MWNVHCRAFTPEFSLPSVRFRMFIVEGSLSSVRCLSSLRCSLAHDAGSCDRKEFRYYYNSLEVSASTVLYQFAYFNLVIEWSIILIKLPQSKTLSSSNSHNLLCSDDVNSLYSAAARAISTILCLRLTASNGVEMKPRWRAYLISTLNPNLQGKSIWYWTWIDLRKNWSFSCLWCLTLQKSRSVKLSKVLFCLNIIQRHSQPPQKHHFFILGIWL